MFPHSAKHLNKHNSNNKTLHTRHLIISNTASLILFLAVHYIFHSTTTVLHERASISNMKFQLLALSALAGLSIASPIAYLNEDLVAVAARRAPTKAPVPSYQTLSPSPYTTPATTTTETPSPYTTPAIIPTPSSTGKRATIKTSHTTRARPTTQGRPDRSHDGDRNARHKKHTGTTTATGHHYHTKR